MIKDVSNLNEAALRKVFLNLMYKWENHKESRDFLETDIIMIMRKITNTEYNGKVMTPENLHE